MVDEDERGSSILQNKADKQTKRRNATGEVDIPVDFLGGKGQRKLTHVTIIHHVPDLLCFILQFLLSCFYVYTFYSNLCTSFRKHRTINSLMSGYFLLYTLSFNILKYWNSDLQSLHEWLNSPSNFVTLSCAGFTNDAWKLITFSLMTVHTISVMFTVGKRVFISSSNEWITPHTICNCMTYRVNQTSLHNAISLTTIKHSDTSPVLHDPQIQTPLPENRIKLRRRRK